MPPLPVFSLASLMKEENPLLFLFLFFLFPSPPVRRTRTGMRAQMGCSSLGPPVSALDGTSSAAEGEATGVTKDSGAVSPALACRGERGGKGVKISFLGGWSSGWADGITGASSMSGVARRVRQLRRNLKARSCGRYLRAQRRAPDQFLVPFSFSSSPFPLIVRVG